MIQFITRSFSSRSKSKSILSNRSGMTLIEIMIVIAIISGLMAVLGERIFGQKDKANVNQAKIQMGQIGNALTMYKNDCGKYPDSLDGLLHADPSCTNWGPEAYMKKEQKDPWGHPFSYSAADGEYTLMCLGKDGKPGGDGYAKDIPYEQ